VVADRLALLVLGVSGEVTSHPVLVEAGKGRRRVRLVERRTAHGV
jgi:hypothetical protein